MTAKKGCRKIESAPSIAYSSTLPSKKGAQAATVHGDDEILLLIAIEIGHDNTFGITRDDEATLLGPDGLETAFPISGE